MQVWERQEVGAFPGTPLASCRARGLVRLFGDETGVAALEVALAAPLFVALVLGAADFALTAAKAREVEALVDQAAKAVLATSAELVAPLSRSLPGPENGGGGRHPQPPPLPALSLDSLVTLPDGASGDLRLFRGCPSDSGITAASGLACPNGTPPAAFAEIAIEARVARLAPWPDMLLSETVTARSVVRLD